MPPHHLPLRENFDDFANYKVVCKPVFYEPNKLNFEMH
jgi:hypothetical protein